MPETAGGSGGAGRSATAILVVCCMSLFIVSLDNTIVNVALPSIARELHASVQTLQWTVDAYLLVLASLLLLSGSLADRLGRKRVFLTGIAIFTFGSLMCGLTIDEAWLIGFRMVQAVGGSMMTPVALAIIRTAYPVERDRAVAIGWWAAVSGVGIAAGPVLGGLLVDSLGWRSIFWINVPIGVLTVVLGLVLIPESRAAVRRAFDPVGQLLVIVLRSRGVARSRWCRSRCSGGGRSPPPSRRPSSASSPSPGCCSS